MGNISQGSVKSALKEHSSYWEVEQEEERKRLKKIKDRKNENTISNKN